MAQATWEKPVSSAKITSKASGGRWKFLIGAFLILGAVGYLVVSGMLSGARYYISVAELLNNPDRYAGQTVRVSGAVIGDTIVYDSENLLIDFTVVSMPEEYTNLADALHYAVNDSTAPRMQVHVDNQVRPELLQHEAQAIMTGTMGTDGIFYVSELNLKCPSRFTEDGPDQSIAQPGV